MQLLREMFGSLGSPRMDARRLALAAKLRLAIGALLIVPTGVTYAQFIDRSHEPDVARAAFVVWTVLIVVFVLVNVVLLVKLRGVDIDVPGWLWTLSLVSVIAEMTSNEISILASGSLTSTGPVLAVLLVAAYRVFGDYGHALLAMSLSAGLFVVGAILEVAFGLPVSFGSREAVEHGAYDDGLATFTIASAVVLALVATFGLVNYGVNQRIRLHRYITESVLRRYLPPSLVAQAARGELRLDAAPERRTVTVLFVDLVGFTGLSETIGADAVGRLLNRYLGSIAGLAHAHGATIDKFVGDAGMFVFGSPELLPAQVQARNAVRLGIALQEQIPELAPEYRLAARVGINTGEGVVGNFGSDVHSDYTVVGSVVNVAARLEAECRPGAVLVSRDTAELLDDEFTLQPAGELHLRGLDEPMTAYFVLRHERGSGVV